MTAYYDPMIVKVAVWAETRDEAIVLMIKVLQTPKLSGPMINLDYCRHIFDCKGGCTDQSSQLDGPAFRIGEFSTTALQYLRLTTMLWRLCRLELSLRFINRAADM